ncbi:hypothetical protein BGX24_001448 [Mortierella sp. AD032]|nr:hypothetical protein BGX24_001448 [Mortierella sp. AD032]
MTETGSCGQSLTWTWCLPNLQVLDLQGEVAYRFKVQSLESCPQLRVLRLTLPPSSPASIGASAVGSSADSSDLMATTTTSATAEPEVSGRPLLSSVPSGPSAWSSRVCACTRRDQRRRQRHRQQQQQQLSLADVLGDDDVYDNDDSEDSDCVCVNWNSNNSDSSSTSASFIGRDLPHHHHHRRYDLFGRLEELKLVGDWGLADSSLLGIAKKMPRLERLSLLRCESDKLTAQGLIRAIPSLRGVGVHVKKGEEGSKNNCRVRWMEICKSWQCEIESAIGSEDEYESSSSSSSQSNMAFVAAVKGGVCPLHIKYQY